MKILKLTITEEYVISDLAYNMVGTFEDDTVEKTNNRLIELFERHNGSQFGDGIFDMVDQDNGYEIIERSEDD